MSEPLIAHTLDELRTAWEEGEQDVINNISNDFQLSIQNSKIKNVSDLPEWFKLEKYQGINELDRAGWFLQIIMRHEMQKYLIEARPLHNNRSSFIRGLEVFSGIIKIPIISIEDDRDWIIPLSVWDYLNDREPIQEFNMMGIKLIFQYLEKEVCMAIPKLRDKFPEHQSDDCREVFDLYNANISTLIEERYQDETGEPLLMNPFFRIDLKCPDNILIKEFKDLLVKLRQKSSHENMRHKTKPRWFDLDSFNRQFIIPYFDLSLWARLNNLTIPTRVYVSAMFPHGECSEKNFELTTIANCKKLFTDETITRLRYIHPKR